MLGPLSQSGSSAELRPRLGVDTGGTFTDFALLLRGQLHTHKVLSTPEAPERAILQGIEEMGLTEQCGNGELVVIHGSTVATNAALQGHGAKTIFITNQGLRDLLSIGRQNRADIYDLRPPKHPPPIPQTQCLEIKCRVDSKGTEIEPLEDKDIDRLTIEVRDLEAESIAICLLFSYLLPEQEQRLRKQLAKDHFVSISSEVLPETGEYERGIATWLNASLGPLMHSYLSRLGRKIPQQNLAVMQSSGGTIGCQKASDRAVNLLLSGPAGGLSAAHHIKQQIGCGDLLTFDMGGTSTDVALIGDQIQLTREGKIGRYPVAVPMVDMHTIGAGGGSIAYLDEAGMLHVGPESAGANPGPAGYGLGGRQATVTDAHIFLGNLPSEQFAGGSLPLDSKAASKAIESLAVKANLSSKEMAQGILDLANEHMTRALRQISVQVGEDPKDYRLCSFGGAGGLHVCALAEKLEMTKALIPLNSGILSALGMLMAPGKRELSKALRENDFSSIEQLLEGGHELAEQSHMELRQEGFAAEDIKTRFSLDCRYRGQSFTLNLALKEQMSWQALTENFHHQHEQNFGYRLDREVEKVNLRVHVEAEQKSIKLPELDQRSNTEPKPIESSSEISRKRIVDRNELCAGDIVQGPALICEASATSWIAPGWTVKVHIHGHLLLDKIY